jgi:hypothetical protein
MLSEKQSKKIDDIKEKLGVMGYLYDDGFHLSGNKWTEDEIKLDRDEVHISRCLRCNHLYGDHMYRFDGPCSRGSRDFGELCDKECMNFLIDSFENRVILIRESEGNKDE